MYILSEINKDEFKEKIEEKNPEAIIVDDEDVEKVSEVIDLNEHILLSEDDWTKYKSKFNLIACINEEPITVTQVGAYTLDGKDTLDFRSDTGNNDIITQLYLKGD